MRYFDTRSGVLQWSSEEINIPYVRPDDGRIHRYYPDFLVKVQQQDGGARTILIEVKPAKQCQPPPTPKTNAQRHRFLGESVVYAINAAKWKAAEAWCQKKGIDFLILTEAEILGKIQ